MSSSTQITAGTTVLGKFTLIRELGKGGMGIVYLAKDRELNQLFAIKIIRPEFANEERFAKQFQREARALFNINHPAIARFYDLRTDPDLKRRCLVMEYVDGISLTDRLRESRLSVEQTVDLIQRIADGLRECHAQGVIHRDIAPDNIILPGGRPADAKLIDFGVARPPVLEEQTVFVDTEKPLKAAYASPEQLQRAEKIDEKTDIYSLGLVALKSAEDQDDPANVWPTSLWDLTKSREQVPEIPSYLPENFASLLRRMLDPDPKRRPSAKEVAEPMWEPTAPEERVSPATMDADAASSGEEPDQVQTRSASADWKQRIRLGAVAIALLVIVYAIIDPGSTSGPPTAGGSKPPSTKPPATSPPQKVGLAKPVLSAKPRTDKGHIELNWTDAATNFAGDYTVYRARSGRLWSLLPEKKIAQTNSTSIIDDSVEHGTNYDYWIVAVAGKKEVESDRLESVFLAAPSYKVTHVSASPADELHDRVHISWRGKGNPAEVEEYIVWRSAQGGQHEKIAQLSGKQEHTDSDVQYGVSYQYAVAAVLVDGNRGKDVLAPPITLDVPGYKTPRLALASPEHQSNRINLEWSSSSDPRFSKEFVVQRAEEDSAFVEIERLSDWQTSDDDLSFGKTYRYRVLPVLLNGESGNPSNEVAYAAPPTAPEEFSLQVIEGTKVQTSWSWDEQPVKHFIVYRTTEAYTPEESDVRTRTQKQQWTDPKPVPCTLNYYSVRAVSTTGQKGALSAAKTARLSLQPEAIQLKECLVLDGKDLLLEWQPLESCDFSAYRVETEKNNAWVPASQIRERNASETVVENLDLSAEATKLRFFAVNLAGEMGEPIYRYVTKTDCLKETD